MPLLRRSDLRHGIGDFADKRSQGMLLGPDLGTFGARFGKLVKNALALFSKKAKVNFVSHSVRFLPYR
jgi:hypothetical protein